MSGTPSNNNNNNNNTNTNNNNSTNIDNNNNIIDELNKITSDDSDELSFCFAGIWAWLALIVLVAIAIALIMYLVRKCIQGPYYRKSNRIDGKVVIVTGCNTGIGKETALELARRGGRVYMACRDAARCEAARLEIIERTQNTNVFNRTLDLGSLASVRQFAQRFHAEEQRLDILVNNAGVMATPRTLTVDGYEQQFAVNHLGHFLLTNLLLDQIKESTPSRIVVVSSGAYFLGRIRKDDLQGEKDYSKFFGAYCQSKLANILFTRKLAELLHGTGVTVNCCHPGLVRTELNRYNEWPNWWWRFVHFLAKFIIKSPKAGAQTSLRLCLDPALEKCTGGFYADTMRFPLLPRAKDKDMADWLWLESEKLVGLRPSAGAAAAPTATPLAATTTIPVMPMATTTTMTINETTVVPMTTVAEAKEPQTSMPTADTTTTNTNTNTTKNINDTTNTNSNTGITNNTTTNSTTTNNTSGTTATTTNAQQENAMP